MTTTSTHGLRSSASRTAEGSASFPVSRSLDLDDDRIMIDIETEMALLKLEMESKHNLPIFAPNPGSTVNPLLLGMLAFLFVFPWLAQLLPQQLRDYIGLLFR
jgi:hypothetical protein